MYKLVGFTFIIFFCSSFSLANAQEIPVFRIYTEEWPPYQFEENGELAGASVELLEKLLMKIGSTQTRESFKLVPWARGYNFLQKRRSTILFLTTRTYQRDPLFKWVGPVFKNKTYLFAKKEQRIVVNTASDLKAYRFGTIIDDAGERYLKALGVPVDALSMNTVSTNNLKMLNFGRVDMVVDNWANLEANAAEIGVSLSNYESVFLLDEAEVSYAFHIDTPNDLIGELQKAFDQLSASGVIDKIFRRYGVNQR